MSAAVGHASPVTTKRYYDHVIRKTYSPMLRAGLGGDGTTPGEGAALVPIRLAG